MPSTMSKPLFKFLMMVSSFKSRETNRVERYALVTSSSGLIGVYMIAVDSFYLMNSLNNAEF